MTRSVPTDCASATAGNSHREKATFLPIPPILPDPAHRPCPAYFPENASGLNAGLTLIVLNVHSSVVFPSTDRET